MSIRLASTRARLAAVLAALTLGNVAAPARAGLVITALDSTAPAGGSGSFDVTITNDGPADVDVNSFQVEQVLSSTSGVHFTDLSGGTSLPYIFGTDPSSQPAANNGGTFPNQDFVGSASAFASPFFQTITAGQTFGLEHVSYSVDAGTAPGPVTVTLPPYDPNSGGGAFVQDANGNSITPTLVNSTITVTMSAVPEPSTLVLALIAGGTTFVARRRRGRASGHDAAGA